MADEEEQKQEESLELYKSQLSQVEQAIQAAGESDDLSQLQQDLQELIKLTEDGLLQLKKARLLASLQEDDNEPFSSTTHGSTTQGSTTQGSSTQSSTTQTSSTQGSTTQAGSGKQDVFDDEYAAFQAMMAADISSPADHPSEATSSSPRPDHRELSQTQAGSSKSKREIYSGSEEEGEEDDESMLNDDLLHLVGSKCRAPFTHDWGGLHYGNAMILSVAAPTADGAIEDHQVKVMFLNPVHKSMIPCKFFMDGTCRFSDDSCRHSHGYSVPVSQLQPFVEPDHSKICVGCRCLAKGSDNVWYPCEVTDVCDDHMVVVTWDIGKGEEEGVAVENILPLEEEDSSSSSSSSSDDDSEDGGEGTSDGRSRGKRKKNEEEEGESEVPVYLWKPAKTTEKLGKWETHTKGIGSKLMAKMGYITGQGLGRHGEGRAEPVPILLLPQGKSLDKIMELKEMAGDSDLFNAAKKLERRQKQMEKKAEEQAKRKDMKESKGVFGFLNQELAKGKKDHHNHHHHHHHHHHHKHQHGEKKQMPKHSTIQDLQKRSDSEVNVQIFKTSEEMRSVERNLAQLRKQLARNETRDRKIAETVRQKIRAQENYLGQLKASSQTLETHKSQRTAHKKLTIF